MAVGDLHDAASSVGDLRWWLTYRELDGYARGKGSTPHQRRQRELVGLATRGVGTLRLTISDTDGVELWGTDIVSKSRNRVEWSVPQRVLDHWKSGRLSTSVVGASRAEVTSATLTDERAKPITDRVR